MSLADFGLLPPEVNSGRMYAGPGAGPMMAAASAWDGLAAQLDSAASSYQAAVSELTDGPWQGPSAASMLAAAAPYVQWMATTAAQAEQTAGQARAAAAAYGAAFAATVPPPVIATNRAVLASLVATNFLGQNTPAIAANQAEYAEMWAQDATAMYGYAGGSAAAAKLTTFTAPPQNTNPAAASNTLQTAASGAASSSSLPNWLEQLLNFNLADTQLGQDFLAVNASFSGIQDLIGGFGYTASGSMFTIVPGVNAAITASAAMTSAMSAASAVPVSAVSAAPEIGALGASLVGTYASGGPGLAGTGVSASLAHAGSLGGLTVPPSWGAASSATVSMGAASTDVRLAAAALPTAGLGSGPVAPVAGPGGWMGGMPMVAGALNAPRTGESGSRFGSRLRVLPSLGGDPGAQGDPANRWQQPNQPVADIVGRFTERNELDELRKTAAELATEREVLHNEAVSLLSDLTQR